MSVEYIIGFILYRLLHDDLHFKNHEDVKCQLKYSPSKVQRRRKNDELYECEAGICLAFSLQEDFMCYAEVPSSFLFT